MMSDSAALQRVLLDPASLGVPEGSTPGWADRAHALLEQQKTVWPALLRGYNSLGTVQTRHFRFDPCQVRVEFNPGRLTSSAAKVDEKSIRERTCFLCLEHLPPEQRGLAYGEGYVILCNPFPIFPEHFTIPRIEHVPQRIAGDIGVFLDLAKDLAPRYTVFYNGPRCGASAPDHMHFQAGSRGFMPIEEELRTLRSNADRVYGSNSLTVYALDDCYRRSVLFNGRRPEKLVEAIGAYLVSLKEAVGDPEEPMVNILAWWEDGGWLVLVFPRALHRPSFFSAEGDARLLISPAAVDMGGVAITPLEQDFYKVTAELLQTMYTEVSLSRDLFGLSLDSFRRC